MLARCAKIVQATRNWTIRKLSLARCGGNHIATLVINWKDTAMQWNRRGSLEFDNFHFGWLCDVLKCKMAHYLTKIALTLRRVSNLGEFCIDRKLIQFLMEIIHGFKIFLTLEGTS